MDEELVLRQLGEDLERDDPQLAARLTGPIDAPVGGRRRPRWWLLGLLLGPLVLMRLFLLDERLFGSAIMLLVAVAPLLVFWFLPPPDDGKPSGRG